MRYPSAKSHGDSLIVAAASRIIRPTRNRSDQPRLPAGAFLVDELSKLFSSYDRGTLSRRHLLQALGVAAVSSVPLARGFGQGQCAGRTDRDTSAACNHTPFKAPFDSTGWKTVLLDHFSMQVTDAEREAAFYAAFMGWKVRSNDGKE